MPSFWCYDEFFWPTVDVPEEMAPQEAVYESPPGTWTFVLAGTTVNAAGAAYPGALVKLFRTGDDSLVAQVVSDGSGAWSFSLPGNSGNYYAVAFNPSGQPMGVTTNTLVAA